MCKAPSAGAGNCHPNLVVMHSNTRIGDVRCFADYCPHLLLKVGVDAETVALQDQAAPVLWLDTLNQELDEPVKAPAGQRHGCPDEATLQGAVETLNGLVALLAIMGVVAQSHNPCTWEATNTAVR